MRRQAAAEYHHRSRGGPVTAFAHALHAHLYGLPPDDTPLPTAFDALLQATHTATAPEQKTAILRQIADQLGNAAEIIQRYQYRAQWDRLPDDVAEQLRAAHAQTLQIAETLTLVAPAFASQTSAPVPPNPQARHATALPTSPSQPAPRRR
ncbi:hypothetical protein [Streptomyces seoulensis]|uniref:hypothetical protein n=1 Tax=Streptomyces seoulensis TaxID=73044 RepID=UPI001FCC1FFD|nr:hypothetical protein [Streptomyces seoulensis]BDH07229.1 hypothetical protein HEK131_44560 [Streptomyces seoulensis]